MAKRRQVKKVGTKSEDRPNIDNTVGTPLWRFNNFRIRILTELLNDLLRMENCGLDEAQCRQVQEGLGQLVNVSTEIPDKTFLGGSIFGELSRFEKTYRQWNDINGSAPPTVKKRHAKLVKLRQHRKKLSQRIRRNQHILMNELDLELVDKMYNAVGHIVTTLPDTFSDLASAHALYLKKLAKQV